MPLEECRLPSDMQISLGMNSGNLIPEGKEPGRGRPWNHHSSSRSVFVPDLLRPQNLSWDFTFKGPDFDVEAKSRRK